MNNGLTGGQRDGQKVKRTQTDGHRHTDKDGQTDGRTDRPFDRPIDHQTEKRDEAGKGTATSLGGDRCGDGSGHGEKPGDRDVEAGAGTNEWPGTERRHRAQGRSHGQPRTTVSQGQKWGRGWGRRLGQGHGPKSRLGTGTEMVTRMRTRTASLT